MYGLRLSLRDDTLSVMSGRDHRFLLYYHGMIISYIFLSKIQYSKRKHVYDYTCMYPATCKHGNRIGERTCYLLRIQRTILLLLRAHVHLSEIGSKIRCYMSFRIYCRDCKNCFYFGSGHCYPTVTYRSSCCALIRHSWSPDLIRGGVTV